MKQWIADIAASHRDKTLKRRFDLLLMERALCVSPYCFDGLCRQITSDAGRFGIPTDRSQVNELTVNREEFPAFRVKLHLTESAIIQVNIDTRDSASAPSQSSMKVIWISCGVDPHDMGLHLAGVKGRDAEAISEAILKDLVIK